MTERTHEVRAKYEFADGSAPAYSTPLFTGSEQECHAAAKRMAVPRYDGTREVMNTAAVVAPFSDNS